MSEKKTYENDYSLLRALDLEAAKAGAKLFYTNPLNDENECAFVANIGNEVCVHFKEFGLSIYNEDDVADFLRMAPLAWVEGKPVYTEDVLYYRLSGHKFRVKQKPKTDGFLVGVREFGSSSGFGLQSRIEHLSVLTWDKPKPVKRWINVYPSDYERAGVLPLMTHACKEEADRLAGPHRLACIEIELPPLAEVAK